MPAPQPNTAWPPKPHDLVLDACRESQVWWTGNPNELADYYGATYGGASFGPQTLGGRWRAAWQAFWGRQHKVSDPKRLHVPVAADICRVSAATLFSSPPFYTSADENETVQDRLDLIVNTPQHHSALLVAGESASALSGTYGRVVWDNTIQDHAWIDFVDADRAIPTFRWGHLTEVTFWTELPSDDEHTVWRHLEHYLPGQIDHYLFEGTKDNLGAVRALGDHPATAALPDIVGTGTDKLAAAYCPNRRPNPAWRSTPGLKDLGRSDLTSDMIHLLDAMDQTWSSWMNDLEIGRGRVFASEELLKRNRPGQGTTFDYDQTLYSPVGMGTRDGGEATVLEAHQFAIRVQEHNETFEHLLRRAVSLAGFSPITFGLQDEVATTATEVDAKERDTNATRQARIRLWSSPLDHLVTTLLEVDAHVFGTGAVGEVEVEFQPMHQQSDDARAQTVQLWMAAQSASTETRVRYLHPDWDDERVQSEVALILDENAAPISVVDPTEDDFADTTQQDTNDDQDTVDSEDE